MGRLVVDVLCARCVETPIVPNCDNLKKFSVALAIDVRLYPMRTAEVQNLSPRFSMNATQAWDVFQLINQGVTIFDQQLELVFWNERFLELLDVPREMAFVGASFESFIRSKAENGEYGDGDIEGLIAERVDVARRFEKHRLERMRPDGTVIEVSGSPLPSGGFVSIYTDITLQKKRELELEAQAFERTRALASSEARLQLIANEVPAGIAHVDSGMNFLFANRKFARAYGLTPESIVGKNCDEVLHPETMAEARGYLEPVLRGGVVDFEMQVRMPKGVVRDVRTYLRPAKALEGQASSVYILSVDVTRNKAATTALLSAQKMDALGRLSSGISHDFNNLLTIILGNLLPLDERLSDPDLRSEFLGPAISAARRGSSLTERLINLARQRPINPQTTIADTALSNMMDILRSSIPESIDLDIQLGAPDVCVRVDGSEFETAILNMVVNARDAIVGSGSIAIKTEVTDLQNEEASVLRIATSRYLKVTLTDSGVGMSPADTEQVFEPFHTTKADVGGSGLGLAMVYSFVRQSNGAIWVESELGKGSAFTMILPTTTADAGPIVRPKAVHVPKARPAEQPLVLLVEDDAEVRKVVCRQLTDIGFLTIEADNAADAIDLLDVVKDVFAVVTDVIMPGKMDGIDLMKAVQQEHPQVAVVLMSGNQDVADHLKLVNNRTTLLRKPFSNAELSDALANLQVGRGLVETQTG